MFLPGCCLRLQKIRQVQQIQMFLDTFAGYTRLVKGYTDNRPHPYASKTRRGCTLRAHPRLMQS